MVEFFAAGLAGCAVTEHGWVQSMGSGCVKPPIVHGDVARRAPLTVRWWRHAQSLTDRPVKAMVTGPVTLLCWSFVRDDRPRADTCAQIALALRDEVLELARAGARAIQVDEPALREGLPLRRRHREEYLGWAIDCFNLAVSGVGDETQIHTHMCYAQVADIVDEIARMDADVLSIEAARGGAGVLDAIAATPALTAAIGPGVYDTRAPRMPSMDEIDRLLALAEARIGRERLWVNPDCGLKSRTWHEALTALERMVAVARRRRGQTAAPA
jgi:5-methyltetrahydropteroyltriglutamate--homocysteine methyltransferase